MTLVTDLTACIEQPEIKAFVEDVAARVGLEETLKRPASSSGKYHPVISNGENGLYHHTKLALLAAERLLFLQIGPDNENTDKEENTRVCDQIRAAIILHDAWKYRSCDGKIEESTTQNHGYVGYAFLRRALVHGDWPKSIYPDCHHIATAIRYHMSHWCHNSAEIGAAISYRGILVNIVQAADMIASDKALIEYSPKAENDLACYCAFESGQRDARASNTPLS